VRGNGGKLTHVPYSPLASPSATIAALQRHGLATKKSLGQHFLVDDNIIGRILDLAALSDDETVLEIGPGIGTLTVPLCARAGAVVAVERDRDLVSVLEDTTAGCARFALVHADAVTVSAEALAAPFGAPSALVANLPYGVAATVVLRCFEEFDKIASATVMVQAEVAERMAATPGRKDYGAYTVKLRLRARPAGRFMVSRGCFLPPPRVESTVLRLERAPLTKDPLLLEDAARVADLAFAQRRKTIRNNFRAAFGDARAVDQALAEAGIEGGLRAEAVGPEAYLRLAASLRQNGLLGG
jgi:16S rRNA (adenine1518-N6/adenine1519-N6)-dimethyltransferase